MKQMQMRTTTQESDDKGSVESCCHLSIYKVIAVADFPCGARSRQSDQTTVTGARHPTRPHDNVGTHRLQSGDAITSHQDDHPPAVGSYQFVRRTGQGRPLRIRSASSRVEDRGERELTRGPLAYSSVGVMVGK